MVKYSDLKIGQKVLYYGHPLFEVYSLIGPAPRKNPRFDGKAVIELFDGGGILYALEDEIDLYAPEQNRENYIVLKGKRYNLVHDNSGRAVLDGCQACGLKEQCTKVAVSCSTICEDVFSDKSAHFEVAKNE